MTADIELLPLPGWGGAQIIPDNLIRDYARANVAHATAAKDAEIEALRAEAIEWRGLFDMAKARADKAEARAERLAEALRLALDSHGVMLMTDPPQDAWKVHRVEEIGRALLRDKEEG